MSSRGNLCDETSYELHSQVISCIIEIRIKSMSNIETNFGIFNILALM